MSQAAEGLHAAHELRNDDGTLMNVVHRDISPQNLFVTYQGGVSVLDFGVASSEGRLHETQKGQVKGKFAYMAPEQLRGKTDRRSDVWSLGVCLWEFLTARKLFGQKTPAELVQAVAFTPIPVPSSVCEELPKALDPMVMKALSREPEQRYQTAREFGLALTRYARSLEGQVGMVELAECMNDLFARARGRKEQLVELTRGDDDDEGTVQTAGDFWYTQQGSPPSETPDLDPRGTGETVELVTGDVDRLQADLPDRRQRNLAWIGIPVMLAAAAIATFSWSAFSGDAPSSESAAARVSDDSTPEHPPASTVAEAEPDRAAAQESTIRADSPPLISPEPDTVTPASAEETESAPRRPRPRLERSAPSMARQPPQGAEGVGGSASSDQEDNEEASPPAPSSETVAAGLLETPAAEDVVPQAPPEPSASPPAEPEVVPTPNPPPAPVQRTVERPTPPPVLDATVSLAAASVSRGTLPTSDVSRAASRALDDYRACYRSAARRAGRDAAGTIIVRFEVDTRGRFRDVRPSPGPLPGLATCVAQASEGLRTRNAPDTGTAQASMQVRFAVRRR